MTTPSAELTEQPTVRWNPSVRLVFADVDETVAGLHEPASPAMQAELSWFLRDGGKLCLITGGSLQRVISGVTDGLAPDLRCGVLVAPASGAQLWGFDPQGELHEHPLAEHDQAPLTPTARSIWKGVLAQLADEFELRLHAARPPAEFHRQIGTEARDVMFSDRGPQVSLEFVNAVPSSEGGSAPDLRRSVLSRANDLLRAAELPISARLTGVFALNMTLNGVSKGAPVRMLAENTEILARVGLKPAELGPDTIEVWGDDFSSVSGGIDLDICEALPPAVRTIDFRNEDPAELPADRNIVLWDGQHRLQHGLLEFLGTRKH